VIVIEAHRRNAPEIAPRQNVLDVRPDPRAGRLQVKDADAEVAGRRIETREIVFDADVAGEALLRPQHAMTRVAIGHRAGFEHHAGGRVCDRRLLSIQEPLRLPVVDSRVIEHFFHCSCLHDQAAEQRHD
jgi:hypothetical protein